MVRLLLKPIGADTDRAGDSPAPIEVQLANLDRKSPHVYSFQRGEKISHLIAEVDPTGAGWMRIGNRVIPFYSTRTEGQVQVWIDGAIHRFEIIERTARRATGAVAGGPKTTLNAPMPGTILKINVAKGDSFSPSQALVIMESMKMEMTLSVPHGGIIAEITCHTGQLVEMGALLARLDPKSGDGP